VDVAQAAVTMADALVALADEGRKRLYFTTKRTLDVVAAAALLTVLVPAFVVIAAAIKLDSRGPVLFRQERVRGRRVRHGDRWQWRIEPFTMLKFRTMSVAADDELHRAYMAAYLAGDEVAMATLQGGASTASYKLAADPRVTRVGRVLRRLSLDELPQLWNVVRGQMSLVGPRPPLPYEVEAYESHHFRRLAGPPGLTGWWQVNGRCETSFEDMVRLDVDYLDRRSFWLDLVILARTVPTAISGRGAG
jgi:lipopolysaccharide/colanic/teichoic acid biosynthesis glycosyltransferase